MIKGLGQILNYLPVFTVVAVWLWAIAAHWKKWSLWPLIWVMIGFHLGLAALKSILQYWVWSQSQLTEILLRLPVEKSAPGWFVQLPIFSKFSHGYFMYYIWNNFWREALFSLTAAFIVYGMFFLLRRHDPHSLTDWENKLILLLAMLVGWPQIILFLPLILLLTLIFIMGKMIFRQGISCSLIYPLFIGTVLMLIFNKQTTDWLFIWFKII
jgi:hypothetical protein